MMQVHPSMPGVAAHASHGDPLLATRALSLRFGGVHALAGASLSVKRGDLHSIIGPNGAGKTSLLNCISGRNRPASGQVMFDGQEITNVAIHRRAALGIGRTFQNLALFAHMSVVDNIMVGRHHLLRHNFLSGAAYWLTGARAEELAHRKVVARIVETVGLQDVQHVPAGTLPYGLRKRVELARALALEPKLLLLDEPMAGMNPDEKEAMARCIVDLNRVQGITVLMIEHDIGVVTDISHRISVLDFGCVIAEGRPAEVMADARVRSAYLGQDGDVEADMRRAA